MQCDKMQTLALFNLTNALGVPYFDQFRKIRSCMFQQSHLKAICDGFLMWAYEPCSIMCVHVYYLCYVQFNRIKKLIFYKR